MISCDPSSLMTAARCFKCIPSGMLKEVQIYLLCQIANAGGEPPPPEPEFNWQPENIVAFWHDITGGYNTNMATFRANADIATVDTVTIPNGAGVTAINNPQLLPGLLQLSCINNNITTLDCSNCALLERLHVEENAQLDSVDISGCANLQEFYGNTCPNLTTVTGITDCDDLQTFYAYDSDLTGVFSFDNLVWLQYVRIQNNPNITSISCNLCALLGELYFSDCDSLISVNTTGCTALGIVGGYNCPDMNQWLGMSDLLGAFDSFDAHGSSSLGSFSFGAPFVVGCFTQGSGNMLWSIGNGAEIGGEVNSSSCPALFFATFNGCLFDDNFYSINFAGCALNQMSVDGILTDILASAPTSLTIDLSGGTNAIPSDLSPTGPKEQLITLGNNVTTNV